MGKASVSLNEHQLPEAKAGRKEDQRDLITPYVATPQGAMKHLLILSTPSRQGPARKGHIGKGWIQLNMVNMSAVLNHSLQRVPVALGGGRIGEIDRELLTEDS